MMDSYDRMQAERAKRNEAVVAELSAVCRQHEARVQYVPDRGIFVAVEDGVRVEWLWTLSARAARTEVTAIGSGGTHPDVLPADTARGFARMSRVLADPAFQDALAIALTRTSQDSARALLRLRQQQELRAQVVRYSGD